MRKEPAKEIATVKDKFQDYSLISLNEVYLMNPFGEMQ